MSRTLTVDIWSDLICPWCWIGKRRFERALVEFSQRSNVRIVHRSFRLMPGVAPHSIETMMARRFGTTVQVDAMVAPVEKAAAEEGLIYRLAGTQLGDTLNAHRVVKLARTQELQEQTIERFYRGQFSEHASLFDNDTLLRLATEAGLERNSVVAVLDSTDYVADVEADQKMAQSLGSNGVPFFLLDGRTAINGGQSTREILLSLTQAWETGQPASAGASDVSPICGPDGCALPLA